jgi:hypothetical protein
VRFRAEYHRSTPDNSRAQRRRKRPVCDPKRTPHESPGVLLCRRFRPATRDGPSFFHVSAILRTGVPSGPLQEISHPPRRCAPVPAEKLGRSKGASGASKSVAMIRKNRTNAS